MTFEVRKVGFAALGERLQGVKGAARDEILLAALMAGGEPIAEAARERVRVGTGRLQQSIGVGTQLSPRQSALEGAPERPTVYVGPGSLPEAITEEFGTAHQAPHPYLRPAWDAEQDAAVDEIARVMSDEITRASGG